MPLPTVLRTIILDYAAEWQLLPWIDEKKISWDDLARNPHPHAIELMLRNPDQAQWDVASCNEFACPYLRAYPELIDEYFLRENQHPEAVAHVLAKIGRYRRCYDMDNLSSNPLAADWLIGHPDWHVSEELSANPSPVMGAFLLAHPGLISWRELHTNPAKWAIDLIDAHPEKYDPVLAANPAGLDLIEKRAFQTDKGMTSFINWSFLSQNPSPRAVELAMTKPDQIWWEMFSKHPAAIVHLARNRDKLDWATLFQNPAIFELVRPDTCVQALERQ